jgi:hypothetical protein
MKITHESIAALTISETDKAVLCEMVDELCRLHGLEERVTSDSFIMAVENFRYSIKELCEQTEEFLHELIGDNRDEYAISEL